MPQILFLAGKNPIKCWKVDKTGELLIKSDYFNWKTTEKSNI